MLNKSKELTSSALIAFSLSGAANAGEICQQPFMDLEFMPMVSHSSTVKAPVGGYNENSEGIIVKFGCENAINEFFSYDFYIGAGGFTSSFNTSASLYGLGLELNAQMPDSQLGAYIGIEAGVIDGYRGFYNDNFFIGKTDLIPFAAITGGFSYELNNGNSIRIGAKFMPTSLIGESDIVAYNIGFRHDF